MKQLTSCQQISRIKWRHEVIFTGRNEVVAKVMFLQVCVCPQGGEGVCLSACWDARPPQPGTPHPLDQADPPRPGRHPPPTPPDQAHPPPGSRLQHTVYERPVRILLECILVWRCVWQEFCAQCRNGYFSPRRSLNFSNVLFERQLIWTIQRPRNQKLSVLKGLEIYFVEELFKTYPLTSVKH